MVEYTNNSSSTVLETKRLLIRPFSLKELICIEETKTILHGEKCLDFLDDTILEAICTKIVNMKQVPVEVHEFFTYFSIYHKKSKQVIGLIGMKGLPDEEGLVELGYILSVSFRRQYIMTEAMEAMLDYLFQEPLVNGAELFIKAENKGSILLAENCEFIHKGKYKEYQVYQYLF